MLLKLPTCDSWPQHIDNDFGDSTVENRVDAGICPRHSGGYPFRPSDVAHAMKESVMSGFMNRSSLSRLVAGAALAGVFSVPGITLGQSLKEQIVGTWRTVSIYNEIGGTKANLYGDKPAGLTMFDRSGNYVSYLSKPDLPKFAVANRLKGTDAENRNVIHGMISGFGTYSVEGDTVSTTTIASSYPNRAGTTEKRTYKIVGDAMSSINPSAASGGTSYQKFVRVK